MSDTAATRPRRRGRWFIFLLIAGVLGLVGWWALSARPWEPARLAVSVERVAAGQATRALAVNGRVTPRRQVDISSTVTGRVTMVQAVEGDTVAAGETLATLDSAQQQAAVAQANAALDAARAQLSQAQVNFERAEALGENISRRDLDAQRLALQTAQDEVNRLTAAREQAETLLAQYDIEAPFDGMVLIRTVDPGQVVSPSSILFNFVDVAQLQAEASVDEVYSAEIRRGLAARLQPSGYNTILEGVVEFVAPKVDTTTGGRLVRVAIDDPGDLHLPIGLTVNVNIVVEVVDSAVTVPRAAIVNEDGRSFVYVVEADAAVRREIDYVDWPAARLIVTQGLAPDDVVITTPAEVSEGAPVRPESP